MLPSHLRLLSEEGEYRVTINREVFMEYEKPIILAQSAIMMADCKSKPSGRPSCTSKPSGRH
jgi:hypothetical protein